jgi:hypothetical protein
MKKLVAMLVVIFTMGAMTACDGLFEMILEPSSSVVESQEVGSSEEINDGESESVSIFESESENDSEESGVDEGSNDENSEETEPDNAVSAITGGGDFNAGNNYN